MSEKNYYIKNGNIARTIIYEDENGIFTMTIDFDLSDYHNTKKITKIYLEGPPYDELKKNVMDVNDPNQKKLIDIITERVKLFIEKDGYEVEIV